MLFVFYNDNTMIQHLPLMVNEPTHCEKQGVSVFQDECQRHENSETGGRDWKGHLIFSGIHYYRVLLRRMASVYPQLADEAAGAATRDAI
jgi:hypothetical protein